MSNWDELSLRDKAEFIKVGVRNGLTSISDIKEQYNKFDEGGFTTPEEEALKKIRATTKPASNYSEAIDMEVSKIREDITNYIQKHFPSRSLGLTNCTLTASQFYGKPIGRASSIVDNPTKYGFYEVDEKYAVPGTMVIASDPEGVKNPKYHSMVLSGFADENYPFEYNNIHYNVEKGDMLTSYSKGRNSESSWKVDIPLKTYNDQSAGKTRNRFYRPFDENGLPSVLLPEVIVTPKGNYVYNSQDNRVNKFDDGGFISVEEYAKMSREEQRQYVETLSSQQRRAFYGHLRQGSKKREQQNRRSKQNNSQTLNTSSKSNKGVEDAYMIMGVMTKSVSQSKEAAKALGMAAVTAQQQSRDERQEKKQEAETFLNAAEVASGVLGLSKLFPQYTVRPKELGLPWYKQLSTKLSNFANDNTTNITNSQAGTYIDWSQLLSSQQNGLSTLENSIEAPISTGGLLQAYGVFPTTNRFGRFINPFLNFAGYTTNIYDVTKPFRSDNEESNQDTN